MKTSDKLNLPANLRTSANVAAVLKGYNVCPGAYINPKCTIIAEPKGDMYCWNCWIELHDENYKECGLK